MRPDRDRAGCGRLSGESCAGCRLRHGACRAPSNSRDVNGPRRIPVATALSAILFLAGCQWPEPNRSFMGESTAQTKAKIRNSFMFISADVFFPAGVPEDCTELPDTVPEAKLRLLHSRLQETLTQVCSHHGSHCQKISGYMGLPMARMIDSRLILTNTGKPLIHAELNRDLVLDIGVLQALFRSTLMTGLAEYPRLGFLVQMWAAREFDFDATDEIATERPERERVEEFLAFKREVETTAAFPAILDLADLILDAFLTDSYSDWTSTKFGEFAQTAAQTEERYLGAILFLFAHEIGHLVLGHFEMNLDDGESFRRIEFEADEYAAALLADAYGVEEAFGGQERVTLDMRGYEIYFQLAERLAGFGEGATERGWSYPTAEERLRAVREIYRPVLYARYRELGYTYEYVWPHGWCWTKPESVADSEGSDLQ